MDLSLWRLHTSLSIFDAAILMVGRDPREFRQLNEDKVVQQLPDFAVVRDALVNAVETGGFEDVRKGWHGNGMDDDSSLNIWRTLIPQWELKAFVETHRFPCAFFSELGVVTQGNAQGSRFFSRKLAAANRAWQAVTADPGLLRGRSPKQALEKWLTAHATELGLLNKDGSPNRTGIEEIAKVVNWKPEGGATPTPGPAPKTDDDWGALFAAGTAKLPPMTGPKESFDLDDEIPF